jgi:hypothetical protein
MSSLVVVFGFIVFGVFVGLFVVFWCVVLLLGGLLFFGLCCLVS